jgi:protease-4
MNSKNNFKKEKRMENTPKKQTNIAFRILGKIWAIFRTYFIGVGMFWTFMPVALVLLINSKVDVDKPKKQKPLEVMGDVLLEIPLKGSFTETEVSQSDMLVSKVFGEKVPRNIHSFNQTLENIANTDHVKGILFRIEDLRLSRIHIEALDKKIELLKSKGKKIWIHANNLDSDTYLLSTHANKLSLTPSGDVTILGVNFHQVFFGEAMRKIGVDIEVVKLGEYKNAFEALISNSPTKETQKVYNSMLDSMTDEYLKKIAKRRVSNNSALAKEWMERSLFTAREAEKDGLIDSVQHYGDFKDTIIKEQVALNAQSAKFSKLKDVSIAELTVYKELDESKRIVLLTYTGDITMTQQDSESGIYPSLVESDVEWALDQEDVAGAVVRINSGGGSALASEIIWNQLKKLSEKMPVVASLAGVAASGGYYMASAANKIISSKNTITGSIGVIGLVPNFKEFESKYGVSFHVFSKSNRTGLIDPGKPLTAKDKEILKGSMEEVYDLFLSRVSEGRNMGKNQVDSIAKGRVWTGLQAKAVGLVDGVGGLNESYNTLKKLAKLDVKKVYPIIKPVNYDNFFDCMKSAGVEECMNSSLGVKSKLKSLFLSDSEKGILGSFEKSIDTVSDLVRSPIQARMGF